MSIIPPILFVLMILWSSFGASIFFCECLVPDVGYTTRRMIFYVLLAGPVIWLSASIGYVLTHVVEKLHDLAGRVSKQQWWGRFNRWLDEEAKS